MTKKPATVRRTRAIFDSALQDKPVHPLADRIAPVLKSARDALVAHAATCPFPGMHPAVTPRWHLDIHYELRQEANRLRELGQGTSDVAWVEKMEHITDLISLFEQLHDAPNWSTIGAHLGYAAVQASGKLIGVVQLGNEYTAQEALTHAEVFATVMSLLTRDEVVGLLSYDGIAHEDLRLAVIAWLGKELETRTPRR